jgi:hypothetical protein
MTTFIFEVKNVPAALYKALGGFATNGVNMTKLESYQRGASFAATEFYCDVEGRPEDANLGRALEELEFHTKWMRVLGTYPQERSRRAAGLASCSSKKAGASRSMSSRVSGEPVKPGAGKVAIICSLSVAAGDSAGGGAREEGGKAGVRDAVDRPPFAVAGLREMGGGHHPQLQREMGEDMGDLAGTPPVASSGKRCRLGGGAIDPRGPGACRRQGFCHAAEQAFVGALAQPDAAPSALIGDEGSAEPLGLVGALAGARENARDRPK